MLAVHDVFGVFAVVFMAGVKLHSFHKFTERHAYTKENFSVCASMLKMPCRPVTLQAEAVLTKCLLSTDQEG